MIEDVRDIALMARKKKKALFGDFCEQAKVTLAER